MFESGEMPLTDADLARLSGALGRLGQDVDDAARIERIRLLEEIKSAAAAAQAREAAEFAAAQRAAQLAQGVPVARAERGVAAQLALAKRSSPYHATRYLGWAKILTSELPHTYRELAAGRISEWRAMLVARETAGLARRHRLAVDATLAPRLAGLGDRRVEAETKQLAHRLDPAGYLERIRAAENDRRVSLRPAPEAMSRLTALLPVAQGVAAYAGLSRAADCSTADGDARGRGQLMADTLVERVTGQARAQDVPVEINLVMSDATLLEPDAPAGQEPAHLDGYGPIPAGLARRLIDEPGQGTPMWVRRLFTRPNTGQLAAMDTHRRHFTANQRHFVRLRDQYCRTPWCEAPIRHTDHVRAAEHRGPTSTSNARGSCQACNHARQAPGWSAIQADDQVVLRTPTGHRYRSRPPDPPGRHRYYAASSAEFTFARLLRIA